MKIQQVSAALLPLVQSHISRWEKCRLCPLCEGRYRSVIYRGRIPCDVLFVGEAPGDSENVQGVPFAPKSQSGAILDHIIETTGGNAVVEPVSPCSPAEFMAYLKDPAKQPKRTLKPARYSWAITNAVACYSDGPPPEQSLDLCSDRLLEFKALCSPKLLVAVGKVADHTITKYGVNKQTKMTVIPHPARILIECGNDNDALDLALKKMVMAVEEGLSWLKI